MVSCPLSSQHTFFVPRLCYETLLTDSIELYDEHGYQVEIKEGKRIIHFKKMPFYQACRIFKELITINPEHYRHLSEWYEREGLDEFL